MRNHQSETHRPQSRHESLTGSYFKGTKLISRFFFFLHFPGPLPIAYGGAQARGRIGAVPTSLHQSYGDTGSKPRLRPTPQLMATPDPQHTEQGQGSNPQPHSS